MKPSPILPTLTTALAGLFLLSLHAPAQTITNPSFELDAFNVFPGYVADQSGGITGWEGAPTNRYGLNPSAGSPFADTGTIPDGVNVAFIQNGGEEGAVPTEIHTDITGLTPGTVYRLKFRANARTAPGPPQTSPRIVVAVDGVPLLNADLFAVGGAAPYRYVALDFTAAAASALLSVSNGQMTGDSTVVVDDFSVAPAPAADPAWSYEAWTDDASSGVDSRYRYTHAYRFGSDVGTVVNDIPFKGIAGGNPSEAGKFTVAGVANVLPSDTNNAITGDSAVIGTSFIYGGDPGTLTLQGLTPSTPYVITLYSTGWDPQGLRPISFNNGDSRLFVDQDFFGQDQGIRIVHNYTSSADGTVTVGFQGLGGTFHLAGFSNRETTVQPPASAPEITVNPTNRQALVGETVTFSGGAVGGPAPTYQWLRNGEVIPGETAANLTVTATGAAEVGYYSFRATNASGTATSGAGYLEVLEPQTTGPLFSTGVDEFGAPLADGSDDPHYSLAENAGGETGIQAVVQGGIPSPPWIANDVNGKWIGPAANTSDPAGAAGRFTYRTSVDAGASPDTFTISGFWAADNTGLQILVNGQAATDVLTAPGFAGYTWFQLSKKNAPSLQAGANNVDFVVVNDPPPGPTGLRVFSAKAPEGIAPVVIDAPLNQVAGPGDTVTFSARAYGTAPLTYKWFKDGVEIPGVTGTTLTVTNVSAASAGSYTVTASNPVGTSPVSAAGVLRVQQVVPGVGPTGIAVDGTPIPDGDPDPRYVLSVNPDGAADTPATVHLTTVFPIVAPATWLGASDSSKWISTRPDSVNAPAGNYTYKTTFNLTGFDPATAVISGTWTSDNAGKAIIVNGTPTGLTAPGTFNTLFPFRIDDGNANFVSGVNTLEFVVENASAGYTALRVDSLRVLAAAGGGAPVDVPVVAVQLSAAGKPVLTFTGNAGTSYTIQRSVTLGAAPSPWADAGQAVADGAGAVRFEDSAAPAGRAFYRVVIVTP